VCESKLAKQLRKHEQSSKRRHGENREALGGMSLLLRTLAAAAVAHPTFPTPTAHPPNSGRLLFTPAGLTQTVCGPLNGSPAARRRRQPHPYHLLIRSQQHGKTVVRAEESGTARGGGRGGGQRTVGAFT
jgi:hypothetical protein